MAVTIKYFGLLAELVGLDEEKHEIEDFGGNIQKLKKQFLAKYPSTRDISFQVALNQTLVQIGEVKDGDEIAFLPPFAGG